MFYRILSGYEGENMNLAVFISGSGSNLKALIDAEEQQFFKSQIKLVVSNKDAPGLKYARDKSIPYIISKDDDEILTKLNKYKIDMIVLAGYLPKISKKLIDSYKIINIHPSLLPKYGGKGFYGMNVHRSVFENKEKVSGVTIHYVNEKLDDGAVIFQEEINIENCKSAEEISKKVLDLEHKCLKRVIKTMEEEK